MKTIYKNGQKVILLILIFTVFRMNIPLFAQCMNDATCYMNNWRNESNAVVRFTVPSLTGGNATSLLPAIRNGLQAVVAI
jgi:hypothetical protein